MAFPHPGTRHKFNAVAVEVDGHRFPSKGEAGRYSVLKLMERAGEISDLVLQPKFPLGTDDKPVLIRSKGYPNGRRARYVADFGYKDRCGARIIEDWKGADTPISALKRAIVEAQYGIRVVVTGARR